MTSLFEKFVQDLVPAPGDLPHKEFQATQEYDTESAAKAAYAQVQERLLSPHMWGDLAGNFGARFLPFDKHGNVLPGKVQEGNYLKISIPLPGNANFDWVKIESLQTTETGTEQLTGLRVRPTEDLQKEGHETAHFFSDTATSSWVLHRNGKSLTAYYYGRGEKPNVEGQSFWKKMRDTIVALAGVAGFSDLQWQAMLQGLLNGPDREENK